MRWRRVPSARPGHSKASNAHALRALRRKHHLPRAARGDRRAGHAAREQGTRKAHQAGRASLPAQVTDFPRLIFTVDSPGAGSLSSRRGTSCRQGDRQHHGRNCARLGGALPRRRAGRGIASGPGDSGRREGERAALAREARSTHRDRAPQAQGWRARGGRRRGLYAPAWVEGLSAARRAHPRRVGFAAAGIVAALATRPIWRGRAGRP
jgi:hypothetical protein